MSEKFERSLEFVLRWEGGLVDDPRDPGGVTNFGISQRAHPGVDIRALTRDGAAYIYKNSYWTPMRCEDFSAGFALVLFDTAVNLGLPKTRDMLARHSFVEGGAAFIMQRIDHYTTLARQERFRPFLRGWLNRTMDLWATARAL